MQEQSSKPNNTDVKSEEGGGGKSGGVGLVQGSGKGEDGKLRKGKGKQGMNRQQRRRAAGISKEEEGKSG